MSSPDPTLEAEDDATDVLICFGSLYWKPQVCRTLVTGWPWRATEARQHTALLSIQSLESVIIVTKHLFYEGSKPTMSVLSGKAYQSCLLVWRGWISGSGHDNFTGATVPSCLQETRFYSCCCQFEDFNSHVLQNGSYCSTGFRTVIKDGKSLRKEMGVLFLFTLYQHNKYHSTGEWDLFLQWIWQITRGLTSNSSIFLDRNNTEESAKAYSTPFKSYI
jgi:hypothetical protein